LGNLDAAGGQELPYRLGCRPTVGVPEIVLDRVETRHSNVLVGAVTRQELVEHLLPRRAVQPGRVHDDVVGVDEDSVDTVQVKSGGMHVFRLTTSSPGP